MRLKTFPMKLLDEAEEWRGKLVEAVAEVDDTLLERYIEDHESITLMRYLQLLENQQFPEEPFRYSAGLLFRNKGYSEPPRCGGSISAFTYRQGGCIRYRSQG